MSQPSCKQFVSHLILLTELRGEYYFPISQWTVAEWLVQGHIDSQGWDYTEFLLEEYWIIHKIDRRLKKEVGSIVELF